MRDRLTTLYVISRVIGRGSPGLVWGILTVCYSIGTTSHDVNLSFLYSHTTQLVIRAADQGVVRLTGIATLNVRVLDANDNPPEFTEVSTWVGLDSSACRAASLSKQL